MVWTRAGVSSVRSNCCRASPRVLVRDFSVSQAPGEHQPTSGNLEDKPEDERIRHKRRNKPRKVIFSGIQPTGIPHLGNYLGAIRQWKQFQDEKTNPKNPQNYQLIFSIVDLHALTHSQSPTELLRSRYETFASLMAIGLDPRKSVIYFQSSIHGHTQLMWYLSNVASTGYLSRMTQWKSKLGVSDKATLEDKAAREKLRLGLFSYPVLQAADILLFRTDLVPVGEDQAQHVEFTRSLAKSFNAQYRDALGGDNLFRLPRTVLSSAKRIMSLRDPTAKMSKSHADPRSRILITDSPDEIRDKFKGAVTDSMPGISYDPEKRPGVSNLIDILKHVSNETASCEEIAAKHTNNGIRAFKEHVAEETIKALAGVRDRFTKLMDPNDSELTRAIQNGAQTAGALAGTMIGSLEKVMGLRGTPDFSSSSSNSVSEGEEQQQQQQQQQGEEEENKKEDNKEKVLREQEEEERRDEEEPDVVPQKDQGVDRPIAS